MTMLKRLFAMLLVGGLGGLIASHALQAQTAPTRPGAQSAPAAKGPRPDQFKYPPLDFKPDRMIKNKRPKNLHTTRRPPETRIRPFGRANFRPLGGNILLPFFQV